MKRIRSAMTLTWPALILLGLVVAWMSWWSLRLAPLGAGFRGDYCLSEEMPVPATAGKTRWQKWPPRIVCTFVAGPEGRDVVEIVEIPPRSDGWMFNYGIAAALPVAYLIAVGLKASRLSRRGGQLPENNDAGTRSQQRRRVGR